MANRNISTKTTVERLAALLNGNFAKKSDIPTNLSQLTNGPGYQTASEVESAINSKIASVYKPGGSKASTDLTSALLVAANEGKVYNITDSFITTADFVEGAGKKYKAGADVGIVNDGTDDAPVYKFNVFANFVDLSGVMEKVASGSAGKLVKTKADGGVEVTNIDASAVLTAHQDISGKADKAVPAAAGEVATLDAQGNLVASGTALTDVVVASDISDYTDAELRTLLGLPAAE